MKTILYIFLIFFLSSCNFRREIRYTIVNKLGEVVTENVIPSNTTEFNSTTLISVSHGEGNCTVELNFTYESGINILDFCIEDDFKKTLKTGSFDKVKQQEIELGNGCKVKINMRKEKKE